MIEGQSGERTITIKNNTKQHMKIKLKKAIGAPLFKRKLTKIKRGQLYRLTLRLSPPYKVGFQREQIQLETNIKHEKTLSIWAMGYVSPRVAVQPPYIRVSANRANQPFRTQLRVINYGKKPVKVLGVSSPAPQIKLTLKTNVAGKNYSVLIDIPKDYNIPPQGTSITIKTDDTKRPVINVPVRSFRPYPRRGPYKRLNNRIMRRKPTQSPKASTSKITPKK